MKAHCRGLLWVPVLLAASACGEAIGDGSVAQAGAHGGTGATAWTDERVESGAGGFAGSSGGSAASAGTSASAGSSGSAGEAGTAGDGASCNAIEATDVESLPTCSVGCLAPERVALGLPATLEGSAKAVLMEVGDDFMTLELEAGGEERFGWSGPPLASAFVVDAEVSVDVEVVRSGIGPGGAGSTVVWTFVRSGTATAATLDASGYTGGAGVLSPDYEVSFSTLPEDFPELALVEPRCCRPESSFGGFSCIFSALRAVSADESIAVDRLGTGQVGEWAVTYLDGRRVVVAEYTMVDALTLLGPATSNELPTP